MHNGDIAINGRLHLRGVSMPFPGQLPTPTAGPVPISLATSEQEPTRTSPELFQQRSRTSTPPPLMSRKRKSEYISDNQSDGSTQDNNSVQVNPGLDLSRGTGQVSGADSVVPKHNDIVRPSSGLRIPSFDPPPRHGCDADGIPRFDFLITNKEHPTFYQVFVGVKGDEYLKKLSN